MIGRAPPGNVRSEVVATTDINQLDISTLDAYGVEALIAAGETVVERKGDLPKDGLGSSVAAYANSGGGWMLLGISNAGEAVGWKQRGRAEVHDWLRSHLREAVDPLPSFNCRTVEYDGKPVVGLRIYPGSPPYVLRGTGAVYIREPGGKHPIRSQSQLLSFVRQNEENEAEAELRLAGGALIQGSVLARAEPMPSREHTRVVEWMLVATPLVLPVEFGTRALGRSIVNSVRARVINQLDRLTLQPRYVGQAQPLGSAFVVDGHSDISKIGVRVAIEAAGTVGARLTEYLTQGVLHTGTMADDRIAPLLDFAFSTLTDLGGSGRGLACLHLRVTPTTSDAKAMITLGSANQSWELNIGEDRTLTINDETTLPATSDSLATAAERMMRTIARAARMPYWEPDQ
jgi:hypothetical protein